MLPARIRRSSGPATLRYRQSAPPAANTSGSNVDAAQTPPEEGANADSCDTGLGELLKKQKAWCSIGGMIAGAAATAAANGPVQCTLPAAMVAAVVERPLVT